MILLTVEIGTCNDLGCSAFRFHDVPVVCAFGETTALKWAVNLLILLYSPLISGRNTLISIFPSLLEVRTWRARLSSK